MAEVASEFELLMIGFDETLRGLLEPALAPIRAKWLASSADVEAVIESYHLPPGYAIFVSTALEGMSHLEVGQVLSSCFQGLNIIFLTADQSRFHVTDLKKNGFTESFLWSMDRKLVTDLIADLKLRKGSMPVRRYKAVKLIDIQPGMELPFEVRTYLPFNDKYVLLTGSGILSQKKFDYLNQKKINSVFVDANQVESFYEFAAERLIQMGTAGNDSVSQTEKTEQFQSTVRELYRSILGAGTEGGDFETGRDLMDQSKKIVEKYVAQKTGLNLQDRIASLFGEGGDFYSHAQIVSTSACLLSMATGIGKPEDLAIAGLFHDIGIAGVNDAILPFELDQLSQEEREAYVQHPRVSLNLLKERRITVAPEIAEIIQKHHERVDGKGYPDALAAHRIPESAHLLAYADALEYLSRPRPGQAQLRPVDIHNIIAERLGLHPSVLEKIKKFIFAAAEAA